MLVVIRPEAVLCMCMLSGTNFFCFSTGDLGYESCSQYSMQAVFAADVAFCTAVSYTLINLNLGH